jgi:hypothetical protein
MKSVFLVALFPLLAACHVQSKDAARSDENVSINADGNGQVAFDLPFAKGDVKLPGSIMAKGNLDIDGVKLMPGSKMTGFSLHGGDKGSTVHMTFTAPQPPGAVRDYFLQQFEQKGLMPRVTAQGVSGTSKDGGPIDIQILGIGSGSQGSIEVQDKG